MLFRSPEDFSSNVLLRPVVQDTLLPTVAYVGGPAEVAYLAQISALYKVLLGRMPVVYPRASFTLLDARLAELLAHYRVTIQDVWAGPQALREKMALRVLPQDLAAAFEADERRLQEVLDDLRRRMDTFDHTLADAVETSARKMNYQLAKIKGKASRAAASRSAQLESDAAILETFIYPHKNLQERVYSGVSLLARFGPGLLDRLYRQASVHCADHQVLVC